MKLINIKLAFDLHGVIMNLLPQMKIYFKEEVGFELINDNQFMFDYPEWYDPRRFGPDIAMAIKTRAHLAEPMRDSIIALNAWRDKGHDILIITASAKSTMDANIKWLKEHLGLPYTIVRKSTVKGKAKPILEYGVTHFVDDRFRTCVDLAPLLTTAFLFDAPHNRRDITLSNMIRIKSLYDAMFLIEEEIV